MELPKNKKITLFALLFILVLIGSSVYFLAKISEINKTKAAFNQEINFQGKIVDKTNGTNISPSCIISGADNDTCDFRVSIYNTSSGGTALWSEVFTDVEIGEYDGILSLDIGSYCITDQGGTWTTDGDGGASRCGVNGGIDWSSDPDLYLQIDFDESNTAGLNNFSSPETFTRKQLSTVPFAYRAESAQNLKNNTSAITFEDVNTSSAIPFSDATYTALPGGYQSVLHALHAASGSGGGLWTINGNVTYLTSAGSDLSLSSTLVSAFSVDESENLVRFGDGSTANAKLDFYSATGDTGRFEYIGDILQWSGGNLRIADNTSINFGSNDDIRFLYDETTDDRLEVTDGTNVLMALTDSGTVGNLSVTGRITGNTGYFNGGLINLGNTNDELRTSAGAGSATSNLYWGNTQVCLSNGTGCNSNYGLWETLTFDSGTNTGTFENDYDVIIGTWTGDETPLSNTNFVLDSSTADDLFVTDLVGVGDSLYVQNNIVIGNGTLTLSDSGISDSNSNLVLSADGANVVQINDTLDINSLITSSSVITFNDVYTGNIPLSDASNTTLPAGATSILDALNDIASGSSSLWDSGAGLTYLKSTTDDVAIGGTTLSASAFSIDVSSHTVKIGSGSVANGVLTMYASDGDTGSITYNTNDAWSFVGGNVGIGVTNPGSELEVSGGIKITDASNGVALFMNTNETGTPTGNDGFRIRRDEDFFGGSNDALVFEKTDYNNSDPDGGISFVNTGSDGVVSRAFNIKGNDTIGIGVDTPTAWLDIRSSTSAYAHINLSSGSDPSSPGAGDFWFDGTELNFYDGSNTYDLLSAGGLWTDGGNITYLSSTTDDFSVGATNTLAAPFSVDVSANTVRIGTASTNNAVLNMYASNGATGAITYGTSDGWIYSGGDLYVQDTTAYDIILDNSTTGSTADSGYLTFRGNYFNVSDTEIDFNIFLDVTSDTNYKLSFYNTGNTAEVASLDESGNLQIDGDLNLGTTSPQDVLRTSSASTGALSDLYWGNDLLCDVSEPNCGWSAGGGTLFTDGGNITYLTQTADDFTIGAGNTLVAPFSVDVSENTVRIGDGTTTNSILKMYASDGSSGSLTFTTNDRWEFIDGDVLIADDEMFYLGSDADFFLGYDETTDDRVEFGMGGNVFGYIDNVASETYGSFTFSGMTILGGDLGGTETALEITTKSSFEGLFLDINLGTEDIFEISTTGIIANVPATFASAGNVQIANDLVFTNSTSANITSDSPLYITAGDIINDEDLILSANNAGYVIVDDRLEVHDLLHLGTNANNYLATSSQASAATDDLYWGNQLVCDASEPNCGNQTLWTDLGSVTHITSTSDDIAIGGTSLTASFSIDVSDNLARIGVGSSSNGKLDFYASNGNSARLEMTTADTLEFNNAAFVFNQSGEDRDFRIEGNNDQNLFFVDAGSDSIGIGTTTMNAWLNIKASTSTGAQINLAQGTDPSGLNNGDLWWNGTNLYFYNGTATVDLLQGGSGSSLFTDGGAVTYLTSTGDDFAIGGTTLVSPFSIDSDANVVRIGDGTDDTNDPTLLFYASDGTSSGSLSFTDNNSFYFQNRKVGINSSTSSGVLSVYDNGVAATGESLLELRADDSNTILAQFYNEAFDSSFPAYKFTVDDSGNTASYFSGETNQFYIDYNQAQTVYYPVLSLNDNRTITILSGSTGNNGSLYFGETSSAQGYIFYDGQTTGDFYFRNSYNNDSGDIIFQTKTSSTAVEGLRIKGSGRLGVGGVTSPDALIDIAAATTSLAQINLTSSSGVDPSSPVSGDLWWNGTNLYFYDGSGYNDLLAGGGGSGLFTDGGTTTYLTSITDDLAIGGDTLTSAFSVNVSDNSVRIGSGSVSNGVLSMYASDGDTGSITYTTDDRWEFSGGDILVTDDQLFYLGSDADFFLGYDETTDDRVEFGMGGNVFGYIDDVSAQTYGALTFSGVTVLGGDLGGTETALTINTKSSFTGVFLDINLGGTDIFEISTTGITANVPATFASAGDVSIANDLVFTNSTSSHITSDSPLYITAGDIASNEDLILSANNAGYVVIDDRLEVTDLIHLGDNADNYLSTSAQNNAATDDLYWGDTLLCDASELYCGWTVSGSIAGGLWTDGGTVSYLTSTSDDFAVGGSTLASPFSVDVDSNIIRIGDGVNDTNDPTIMFYASDATNSGSIEFTDNDSFYFNGGNVGIGDSSADYGLEILGTSSPQFAISYDDGVDYATFAVDDNGYLTIAPSGALVYITGSLAPTTGDVYTLGTSTNRWQDIYVSSGSIHIGEDGNEGIISYDTINNAMFLDPDGDSSPEFTVNGTGSIGINTNNPQAMLDINNETTIDSISINTRERLWTKGIAFDGGTIYPGTIVEADDGGFMVNGYSTTSKIFVGKFNKFGELLWGRLYGNSDNNGYAAVEDSTGHSMIKDSDGNYVIAGQTYNPSNGNNDIFVLKIDNTGKILWSKTIGGTADNEESYAIIQTSDGGYAITGFTESYGQGDKDVYIVKITSAGALSWTRTVGNAYSDIGYDLDETSDNGIIVVGQLSYSSGKDVYMVKVNSSGTVQWTQVVGAGGTVFNTGYAITVNNDDTFVVAGMAAVNNFDSMIMKMSADSPPSIVWKQNYDIDAAQNSDTENIRDIAPTSDGGYITIAMTSEVGGNSADDYGTIVTKFTSTGTISWDKRIDYSSTIGFDYGSSIIETSDGGYAFVGLSGSSVVDLFIAKVNSSGEVSGSCSEFSEVTQTTPYSWSGTARGSSGTASSGGSLSSANGEYRTGGQEVNFCSATTNSMSTAFNINYLGQTELYSSLTVNSSLYADSLHIVSDRLYFGTGTGSTSISYNYAEDSTYSYMGFDTSGDSVENIKFYSDGDIYTNGSLYIETDINTTTNDVIGGIYFGGTNTESILWSNPASGTGSFVISDNLRPDADSVYNLGMADYAFANIYADTYWGQDLSINNFDVAEEYLVDDETISAGDVVRFKQEAEGELIIERAGGEDEEYDNKTIGVISTDPGLYLKEWKDGERENGRPVALVGRVPVKVSNENGPIRRGDFLTASSTPGYAMKATEPGLIIGRAMEDFFVEEENPDPENNENDSALVEKFFSDAKAQMVDAINDDEDIDTTEASEILENFDDLTTDKPSLDETILLGLDGEENQAETPLEDAEETVAEDEVEVAKGRIMMFVDLGFVGPEGFDDKDPISKAFSIESFSLENGDNLFELHDNPESTQLKINIDELIVAGAMKIEGDVEVLGKLTAKSIQVENLTITDEIKFDRSSDALTGEVILPAGEKEITIQNTSVTSTSIIYLNADQFVSHRIKAIDHGVSFTIEVEKPVEEATKFNYLIFH